jgi:hypothetical protein
MFSFFSKTPKKPEEESSSEEAAASSGKGKKYPGVGPGHRRKGRSAAEPTDASGDSYSVRDPAKAAAFYQKMALDEAFADVELRIGAEASSIFAHSFVLQHASKSLKAALRKATVGEGGRKILTVRAPSPPLAVPCALHALVCSFLPIRSTTGAPSSRLRIPTPASSSRSM